MKKFIFGLLVAVGCFSASSYVCAEPLTILNCESWKRFVDMKTAENLDEIYSPRIQELHDVQLSAKTWTKKNEILNKDWDEVSRITDLDNESPQDAEYIRGVQACAAAMAEEAGSSIREAFLKKAELHIERSSSLYREVETKERMPFVRHGGVLPGTTEKGEASDYVESKFIPKFVNTILVMLISLSVLMLIAGGVMFLVAAGDSETTARAKTTVMWAVVGVVITILSYSIVQFIIGIDFSL